MTIVDDVKLEQLAARRPKDLFPILERSASLSPLLFVLTFLPGIIALESASIDELDAQWRLKSLEISTAPSVIDVIDPSGISQTDLKWQPPLGSWIAAGAVHLPGPVGSHGLELVDYLSAASLVPASYFLASRLLGRRIGFITALLVAIAHHVPRATSECHAAWIGHPHGDGRVLGISGALAARGRTGLGRPAGRRNFAGAVSAWRGDRWRSWSWRRSWCSCWAMSSPFPRRGERRPCGGLSSLVGLAGVPLSGRAGRDGVRCRRLVGVDDALLLRRRVPDGLAGGDAPRRRARPTSLCRFSPGPLCCGCCTSCLPWRASNRA